MGDFHQEEWASRLQQGFPIQPYSIPFCSIVHIKKIHGEKTNHQRRKSTISFSSSYFSSHIRREKQKSSRTPDDKKAASPKKKNLSHPSVIEKSIKRVQNKDVSKSQRKS